VDENHLSEEQRRSPSRLIPIALILLFLAGCGFGFLKSSYFLVDHIDFSGLTTISHDEIMTVVSYAKNTNIFDVDLIALAERIETNPRVDKVTVKRRLPSTLVLDVQERAAVAVMPYSGYYVLVDKDGFAIGITESYREKDPPLITGIRPQQVLVGKRIDLSELDSALLLTSILPPHLMKEVSEINFAETVGISIYLQSGTWVALGLGTGKEYLTRVDVLNSLLVRLDKENRHASYIDVRFPKRPVVKDSK